MKIQKNDKNSIVNPIRENHHMFKLDLHEHLPKLRKAYEDKRLAAQMSSLGRDASGCVYVHPYNRAVGCGVGVMLDQETREILIGNDRLNAEGVRDVVNAGVFDVDDEQLGDLIGLQIAHDSWSARDVITNGDVDLYPELVPYHGNYIDEKSFAEILAKLETKYPPKG